MRGLLYYDFLSSLYVVVDMGINMIKNIIFDIGQVLAKFRWREYIEDFGYHSEIEDRLAKATVLSVYWSEIDRGLVPMEEIIELCVLLDREIEQEIREFYKDTRRLVVEYDYSSSWLKELKALGFHIYLLSNYGEVNFSHVKEVFSFFQYVDGAIISYQEKCIKPEEKIYRILLDRYQLIPSECIFLDDLEANIEAAKNLGIHSIQVLNYQQAKEDLNHKLKGMV
jgi:putative hydrolase of the HAD superfamily